ncbi:mechanosensitive ion channel domain-containing protein [uncultured Clostridium sp.]|uniref:mechanosensitive ion channel domain-containing protein n=1 Tax=uncultured Clostridium sp. TaxID=59620 RepID=UPI0026141070|nr:mechanosensitive ion channel domain-containing protein [uncultured Clostridium sp.]
MVEILAEYYIYGEDELGNFTGNFNIGDYVIIETYDKKFKCIIRDIREKEIVIEDDDYEEIIINISDILEIHNLFC